MKYTKDQSRRLADGCGVPTIFFKCNIKFQERLPVPQPHQGFQGWRKIHGTEQSWADMVIGRRPTALRIKIEVKVWHTAILCGQYSHQTHFHPGQWILRDLFDVFSNIQNRSLEDHTTLSSKDDLVNVVFSRARQQEAVQEKWLFGAGSKDCFTFNLSQNTSASEHTPTILYDSADDVSKHKAVEKQIARLTSWLVFTDRSTLKGKIVSSVPVAACRRGFRKLEHRAKRTYAGVLRGMRHRC